MKTTRPCTHNLFLSRSTCILVIGGARTGLSTARWLQAQGLRVLMWDDHPHTRDRLAQQGFEVAPKNLSCKTFWDPVDAMVIAPGVPHLWPAPHPLVQQGMDKGIPILSELDLWLNAQPSETRVVGITGTNGKSTTTALIHHLLKENGWSVSVGGNIGIPLFDLQPASVYVLELSSYQLERTQSFSVDVGVLLNITPDHLERHGGMAGYIAAKQKLFRRKPTPQTFVLGQDTGAPRDLAAWLRKTLPSSHRVVEVDHHDGAQFLGAAPRALQGDHNLQNMRCAYEAVRALGLTHPEIERGMHTFPGLEHRQEYLGQKGLTSWVNDSKATNIASVCTALARFERVYWIAGGRPKEEPLLPLLPFQHRLQKTFLIGEAIPLWEPFLKEQGFVYHISHTLDQAVADAYQTSREDPHPHTILLSPGCASFDQFAHFEERGHLFKKYVEPFL